MEQVVKARFLLVLCCFDVTGAMSERWQPDGPKEHNLDTTGRWKVKFGIT